MRSFKDTKGRSWSIEINVAAVKRVRSLAGLDLLDLQGGVIQKMFSDPIALVDTIYALVKPQADNKGVTDEDFGAAMAGDAIHHATAALMDELVSFSPNPRDRANLEAVLKATNAVMDKARDLQEEQLKNLDLDKALSEISGKLFTSSPASSESTPPT